MLMRMAFVIAISGFANTAASAQTPSAPTTSSIELRINATGQSVKPADYVTVYVPISTRAETALAARAANNANIAKLTTALVARGIDRNAITVLPSAGRIGFIGNEVYDQGDTPVVPQELATVVARKSAFSIVQIRVTNTTLIGAVRDVLDQQNLTTFGRPLYALKDDRAAKNAAVADAIVKAKQEADAYAAPLGLRVDRITSVSNYGDATPTTPDSNFLMQMMIGGQESEEANVETRVQVWVNFVLVPR